jgi:hypothetical protein
MKPALTVAQLNERLAALDLEPLDCEQVFVLTSPACLDEREAMLEDLRDRCGLPLTDDELTALLA